MTQCVLHRYAIAHRVCSLLVGKRQVLHDPLLSRLRPAIEAAFECVLQCVGRIRLRLTPIREQLGRELIRPSLERLYDVTPTLCQQCNMHVGSCWWSKLFSRTCRSLLTISFDGAFKRASNASIAALFVYLLHSTKIEKLGR